MRIIFYHLLCWYVENPTLKQNQEDSHSFNKIDGPLLSLPIDFEIEVHTIQHGIKTH